jgi:hypothetical protein
LGFSLAAGVKWQVCRGAVLQSAVEASESLKPYIADGGGIYFWKLSLRPEVWESSDAAGMVEWLESLTKTIRGKSQFREISHIIQIPSIELRGRKLTKDKVQYLNQFLQNAQSRVWLKAYIESLEQFSPTLYVGETGNFQQRASEHIRYLTDFGIAVQENDDLSWDKLDFHYTVLANFGSTPERLRKSVENISAAITIAGLTKRPG